MSNARLYISMLYSNHTPSVEIEYMCGVCYNIVLTETRECNDKNVETTMIDKCKYCNAEFRRKL